jgi:hypothetical protein
MPTPTQTTGSYVFEGGFPAAETIERAYDDADLNRAVQAYRFFFPTVSGLAIFKVLPGHRRIPGHVLADADAGADDHAAAQPDVVGDGDGLGRLPLGPAGLGFQRVGGREELDVGADLHVDADHDDERHAGQQAPPQTVPATSRRANRQRRTNRSSQLLLGSGFAESSESRTARRRRSLPRRNSSSVRLRIVVSAWRNVST